MGKLHKVYIIIYSFGCNNIDDKYIYIDALTMV